MLKRRGRSFDSFYPTTPRDSVGKRKLFLRSSIIEHFAFPDFIRFFFFLSEFLFRLLRVRFDKSSLCSILLYCFISTNWFLFLNVDVSSAKKFSLQTNVSNEMKICGIRIDQTMIIYESIDFSNKKNQLISTLRITSISLTFLPSLLSIVRVYLSIYIAFYSFFILFNPRIKRNHNVEQTSSTSFPH